MIVGGWLTQKRGQKRGFSCGLKSCSNLEKWDILFASTVHEEGSQQETASNLQRRMSDVLDRSQA